MGEARHVWLAGNSHRTLPFAASAAMNEPLFSPKNTRPDAVDIKPAELGARAPACGRSQAIAPVWISIARTDFVYGSSGAGRTEPPMKPLPASHSIARLEYRLHRSSAWK